MMYFSEVFVESKGNEAIYKGEKIYSCDIIDEPGKYYLKFKFIKENKKVEQLIVLSFDPDGEYNVYYRGKKLKIRGKRFPTIDLTKDFFGKEFVLEIELIKGKVGIHNGNIKMLGDKRYVSYMSREHAMKIETKGNTKRYICNSTLDDDDFDDLIFEIEFLDKYEKDYYNNLNEVYEMYKKDYRVEWENKGELFYLYFNNDNCRIYISEDTVWIEKYNKVFKKWFLGFKHYHYDNLEDCVLYCNKFIKKNEKN